jgi:transcriptional regulator NrdR family protein
MVCTYCSAPTGITNSRLQKRTNTVWRRHLCRSCGAIFSSIEHVDYEKTWVVQYSSGSFAPFMRDKLFVSIYKSCQHRPTALQDAIGLTNTIIGAVHKKVTNGSLTTKELAVTSHAVLKRFDQPAAISYQAYHADVL